MLIEASPSRRTLYVGEPLLLTYYLYTQVQVADLQAKEAPQFTGFWVGKKKNICHMRETACQYYHGTGRE